MAILLFPGQGSKSGNLQDLRESPILQKANELLGYNVLELTQEQSADTAFSQPSIFIKSMVLVEEYKKTGVIDLVAGHSMGQYTAAVAAGALTFEEGLELVRLRGQFMSEAAKETSGGMVACIGHRALDSIEPLIGDFRNLYVANYNSSQQIVVSGETSELNNFINICLGRSIRCIKLGVAGAFHSPLMDKANIKMNEVLEKTEFKDIDVGFISNKSGDILLTGERLRNEFIDQIIYPVRWTETMKKIKSILQENNMKLYEIGTDILTKLLKVEQEVDVELYEGAKDVSA